MDRLSLDFSLNIYVQSEFFLRIDIVQALDPTYLKFVVFGNSKICTENTFSFRIFAENQDNSHESTFADQTAKTQLITFHWKFIDWKCSFKNFKIGQSWEKFISNQTDFII